MVELDAGKGEALAEGFSLLLKWMVDTISLALARLLSVNGAPLAEQDHVSLDCQANPTGQTSNGEIQLR